MKKISILFILLLIFIPGCEKNNIKEDDKSEYIAIKSDLLTNDGFTELDELDFNLTTSANRINDEEISYRVIIDNPKVNMNDIKAMVVHNYFTEDIFPSIGLFDDKESLIIGNDNVKGIELVGYIETSKDIDELNLELKIWVQYILDSGEIKDIYCKRTIS